MTEENQPKVFAFKDLMDDPGLAFRLTMDELQDILDRHVAASVRSAAGVNLNAPKNRKPFITGAAEASRTKMILDKHGKTIVEGWKKQCADIDIRRKLIRDTLDKLRDDIRLPVTDWERREKARLAAEAEKAARLAQDGQEASKAITLPDAPETPATDEKTGVYGTSPHAAPSVPMLTLSQDAAFISFHDKETGGLVFQMRRGEFGQWAAEVLFSAMTDARGARFWNTHGLELHRFDSAMIYGRL